MTLRKREKRKLAELEKDSGSFSIEFLNQTQKDAWYTICENDVTFLSGPAGTGKTFLAMAYAVSSILTKNHSKIILTRPVVESGESLGFLPGDFQRKVDPYMFPLFDCFNMLLPGNTLKQRRVKATFEIAPFAYMRGRTFHDSVCICDEAQNTTRTQLKLFLSRMGKNSKLLITGDPFQTDLDSRDSGFSNVVERLCNLPGVGIVHFNHDDIVRHELISKILARLA